MSGLEHILAEASPWLRAFGYPLLALTILLEGVGIPLPGGILMSGAALLAGQGEMNIYAVWLTAWLAAAAGDNLGYWIGFLGGRRLLLRAGLNRRRLLKFHRFYRRFGLWLVLFGRFFDGTRQLNGLVAGSAGLPWLRFLMIDGVGVTLWVSLWVIGLYSLDRHTVMLHRVWMQLNPWVVMAVICALAIFGWLLFRRSTPTGVPQVNKPASSVAAVVRQTRTGDDAKLL